MQCMLLVSMVAVAICSAQDVSDVPPSALPEDDTCHSEECSMKLVQLRGIQTSDTSELGTAQTAPSMVVNLVEDSSTVAEPIVRASVEPKDPMELPKMFLSLRRRLRWNDQVTQDWGNYFLLGATEADLLALMEIVEKDVPVKMGTPVAIYRETVGGTSSHRCRAWINKGAGRASDMTVIAQKMPEGLVKDIENQPNQDTSARAKYLAENYDDYDKYHIRDPSHIWVFGPNANGPNVFIDTSMTYALPLKNGILNAFEGKNQRGVLCEEPMRGVRIDLVDANLCPNKAYRGDGAVRETASELFKEAVLSADPGLSEPVYLIEVQSEKDKMDGLKTKLSKRRGKVIDEKGDVLKAYLPVAESFGFMDELRALGIQASPKIVLDHWRPLDGNPLDATTEAGAVVAAVRKAKGLK